MSNIVDNLQSVLTGESSINVVSGGGTDIGIKKLISTVNSTAIPLTGGAVFTGIAEDMSDYAELTLTYDTDVAGAVDGLQIQLSTDGTNYDKAIKITPPFNGSTYGGVHTLVVASQYVRVVYTNGTSAQAHLRIQTMFHSAKNKDLTSRSQQVLNKTNDVNLVRNVTEYRADRNFGLIGYENQMRKFGLNEEVGNTAFEDIISNGGNYTPLTVAETIRVKAGGNVNDTSAGTGARTITVEGLDANFDEITENLTLAGASASSATSSSFIAVNKVFILTVGTYAGANTGVITIEGVSSSTELAWIQAEAGNTQQAVYTVPAGKSAYVTGYKFSVGQNNSADVRMYHIDHADDITAPFTSVKHIEFTVEDFSGVEIVQLDTYLKFLEKNIICVDAKRITGSGSARVSADYDFILVDDN